MRTIIRRHLSSSIPQGQFTYFEPPPIRPWRNQ